MEKDLVARAEIFINASASEVWDGLTNPAKIKQYFFGTDAVSDWKEGSELIFKGEWEGKEYVDKGKIIKSEKDKLFQYNYFSAFSGKEDVPENYMLITYELIPENGGTRLKITQDHSDTQEQKKHSEENWAVVLKGLKELVEAG